MEILTELDLYREALSRVNMNEEVMPFVRGKLLRENVDVYAKIQKILNCDCMANCHRFLYDLDVENLTESEITKVCNLYKLGQERGVIEADEVEECDDVEVAAIAVEEPAVEPVATKVEPQKPELPASAYVVLYSAMRDGQIKTGEAFSNAINTRSAKADVINKLEKAGYQNVSILAIEAGDPDMSGCYNTFIKQAEPILSLEDEDVEEADEREPLAHALDPVGVKASTANSIEQDAVATSLREEDDEEKSDDSDDSEESDDSEDADEKEDSEDTDDKETDDEEKEESAEEPDEKLKGDEEDKEEPDATDDKKEDELSDAEKGQLKDSYKKAFKAAMIKCKYTEKSFDDLTLDEKVKFFTELSKAWGKKADPSKFMSDKEMEALEAIVVKK